MKVKKLIVSTLFFFSFAFANDPHNCKVLSEMFDNCVNNTEILSCRDRGIALFYSLKQANFNTETIKPILKLCIFYCQNPNFWDKQAYLKACLDGFRNFKEQTKEVPSQ